MTLKNITCQGGAALDLEHVRDLDFGNIRNGDGSVALRLEKVTLKE